MSGADTIDTSGPDYLNPHVHTRRKSLVETPLPQRSLSWAGNLQANLLTKDLPKKENKLPEYRLKKSTKQGESIENDFIWTKTDMIGFRSTMEDADLCISSLPSPFEDWSFFAVLDGHGGDEVAKRAADLMVPVLLSQPQITKITNGLEYEVKEVEEALRQSFIDIDAQLHVQMKKYRRFAGATCTSSLITPNHIFTSNLGDSRTLIVKKVPLPPKIPSIIFETQDDETIAELASTMDAGVSFSTTDHNPSNPRENRRISDCGLRVRDGRIQGNLAVARAFGDFQYKKNEEKGQLEQAVSCLPDVHCFQRSVKDEYIVMACDGVYDVFSNDELAMLLRAQIAEKENITAAAEEILNISLNRGSIDNMTIIVITFGNVFRDNDEETDENEEDVFREDDDK